MPLGQRFLQVNITMPQSGAVVTIDQTMEMHVQIHKDALAIQNKANITIFNLTHSARQQLLSNFTAFNKRQAETGVKAAQYCAVEILAGYTNNAATAINNGSTPAHVFQGDVVLCEPVGAPPNLGVQITCYEHQLDKLQWKTEFAPVQTTFKQYVEWAGRQMGVERTVCQTSYDNKVISNPGATAHTVEDLLLDIQSMYRPAVAAFIDNNDLIVMDMNKVIAIRGSTTVDEFVGTPMWTEWGVQFQTLFNPAILLAGGVTLKSKMNPSLNNSYVVSSIDYDLTSRDTNFHGKYNANPAA